MRLMNLRFYITNLSLPRMKMRWIRSHQKAPVPLKLLEKILGKSRRINYFLFFGFFSYIEYTNSFVIDINSRQIGLFDFSL